MAKSVVLIIAARFIQALLSIAALRLMTFLLSPEQVGGVYLMLSFATGFSFFLISPVGMYINRRLHVWQNAKVLMSRFLVFNFYVLSVAAAAVIVTLGVKALFGAGAGMPPLHFAAIVAAYVYCNTWNMTLVPSLNMLGYRASFALYSTLTTGLGLAFSSLIVIKFAPTAFSWFSGQIVAMLLIAVVALCTLITSIKEDFKGIKAAFEPLVAGAVRNIAGFTMPLAWAALFMWLQTQGYRLIVERQAGAGFLGYMAVGLGIAASLAAVCESLVQQIYLPGFYKDISTGDMAARQRALAELAEKTIPVYVVLTVFTISLSPQLTALLIDPKFQSAEKFVVFGALIEFFRMSANIVAAAAHSEMRTDALVKPYAMGGIAACMAIYAVSALPAKGILIPLAMIFGGVITFLFMLKKISSLIHVRLEYRSLLKAAIYAAPLFLCQLFRGYSSFWVMAGVLALAGIYFLFLQYRIAFKWTRPVVVQADAPNVDQIGDGVIS